MLHAGDEWTLTADEVRNPRAGIEKLIPAFSLEPRLNKERSKEEGRPCYSDVPYIRIFTPGDQHNVVHRPVNEQDKVDFPRQWAAFVAKEDQNAASGTLLEKTAIVTRAQAEELKHFKIRTVEQLANVPDGYLKFEGAAAMKRQAQAYLESAKGNAPITKMQAELEQRDSEIQALKKMLEAQSERIDQLVKAKETQVAATAAVVEAVTQQPKQQPQKGGR